MSFSGRVLLGDLDDFIAPAQVCTTGLFSDNPNNAKSSRQLVMEDDFNEEFGSSRANIIRTNTEKIASVSLEDCLACSGCVTSAETILIQQQSTETFLQALKKREYKVYIVVISRPSLVSVANTLGKTVEEVYEEAKKRFLLLGVDIVVRQDVGEYIAMMESILEYKKRKQSSQKVSDLSTNVSYAVHSDLSLYPKQNQLPGTIDFDHLSSTSSEYDLLPNSTYFNHPEVFPSIEANCPFITSNCPGWVCYAEKKAHAFIPYLSTTCSAQQIMGVLLRLLLPSHIHSSNNQESFQSQDFYITSVVSCYDRKLEASRRDFLTSDKYHTINCVLSTQELLELLTMDIQEEAKKQEIIQWDEEWWTAMEKLCLTDFQSSEFSSGGVLAAIIGNILNEQPDAIVEKKTVRNSDFVEVTVKKENEILMKGAFIYGFRNIQNLVMKMKRKKCLYDIVEVMACPSGCLNGGGQIRPEKREDILHIASDLIKVYQQGTKQFSMDNLLQGSEPIYQLLDCKPGSEKAYSLFHTRFHIIPEITVNSLHW